MEETHYRMYLYQCKKKIKQFEILVAQIGPMSSLATPPPPLIESTGHTVGPILDTDVKVHTQGTRKTGHPTLSKQNATRAAALAAI